VASDIKGGGAGSGRHKEGHFASSLSDKEIKSLQSDLTKPLDIKAGGPGSGRHPGVTLNKLTHLEDGWISGRDGKFYAAGNLGHSHAAERDGLVEKPKGYSRASNTDVLSKGHVRAFITDGRSYLEGRSEDQNVFVLMYKAMSLMPPGWTTLEFVETRTGHGMRTGQTTGSVDFDNPEQAKKWLRVRVRSQDVQASDINWTSPSSPAGGEYQDAFVGLSPIPTEHPPSLKNPIKTKIPTAQDGWRQGDSKASRRQAMKDLKTIHTKLRHQLGKPEIAIGVSDPIFPSIWQNT
jgi:hypothetical protein